MKEGQNNPLQIASPKCHLFLGLLCMPIVVYTKISSVHLQNNGIEKFDSPIQDPRRSFSNPPQPPLQKRPLNDASLIRDTLSNLCPNDGRRHDTSSSKTQVLPAVKRVIRGDTYPHQSEWWNMTMR
ncbi:hypothetical protein HJC23_011797 [Cyclotella cryptica]|uniref:Uncharacterized protein n=1 Tax=Cyclotella cryptica TaxID=29204 RepID=A0ABD3PJ49_9STRA|eukprot:CCRYP_014332-RA/>CCRYP_014332-RA protein AED:0.14 eAED:0.19 QI:0/0/0.5/1/0/0/2/642/125